MMALAFWPLILLTIRDIHEDRKYAERDIKLGLYGRTIYIIIQVFFFYDVRKYLQFQMHLFCSVFIICCRACAYG